MGPRCQYSTTVEVAYPFREWKRLYEKDDIPHFVMRIVIPEPNLWDPQSPFLYEGPMELWQGKERCDQVLLSRGLRTLNLGPPGLRWNGRALAVRGIRRDECTDEEALRYHQQGYNTLLSAVGPESDRLWKLADRFGFLMLGRINSKAQIPQAAALTGHPSSLGWVFSQEMLEDPLVEAAQSILLSNAANGGCIIGVELFDKPAKSFPGGVQFVLGTQKVLPLLSEIALPKVILREGRFLEVEREEKLELRGNALGSICCEN